jgi:hypothetical protein
MTGSLPEPALFTKGSRWRFIRHRHIYGTGQRISAGEEFTVAAPLNNPKTLAIRSETIFDFRTTSDQKKYSKRSDVTATLNYNEIFRFVEMLDMGQPIVYYLKSVSNKYFLRGNSRDNDYTFDFSEARYYENRLSALKAWAGSNGFYGSRSPFYERYRLMGYDTRTLSHSEVFIRPKLINIMDWVLRRVSASEAEKKLFISVLARFESDNMFFVKCRSAHYSEIERVSRRLGIKPPSIGLGLFACYEDRIADATMIKMAIPGVEILEI